MQSKKTKGIILAGGTGSRLWPLTKAISKQQMPVWDKPMIFYPLNTLMRMKINEVLVITTPEHSDDFQELLGDGSAFGMKIEYAIQPKPDGLAQAFIIGEEFIGDDNVALILGDNIFISNQINHNTIVDLEGGKVFAYPVNDPERYGVVEFDKDGKAISIVEKPEEPKSRHAVTGLYVFDNDVVEIAKNVKPSARGELEITDVNQAYLERGKLTVERLGVGDAWLDTGTFESMYHASEYVRVVQERTGMMVGCPYVAAYLNGWITEEQFVEQAKSLEKSGYGKKLLRMVA